MFSMTGGKHALVFFRPVIEQDAAVAFIAGTASYTFRAIVHREGIAALNLVGLFLRNNLREQSVARTLPDSRVTRDRAHAMSIARMRAPHFAQRIRSTRLL